jgi:type I restriction enzyme S subunit
MAGAYLGMVGMVKESFCPANTNQAVGIIRINNPSVYPKFVEYALRNPSTIAYVNSQSGQSAQPNINLAEIGNLTFLFPPLQEQKSIASILSALDDKIELNLQMNKTLEEMAMALYKHWFVDFGPFQNGEFVDSELGMIPEGWEVKLLDEVVELIIDHRGKTPKKLGGDWSVTPDGCFQAISAKNIKSGKIVKPDTIKFLGKKLFYKWMKDPLKNKDILLTSEAPIGEYYFILNKTDYCLSQRLFGIRANPRVLHPELLYCFLSSTYGQQQLFGRGSGSTVQGIKQSELRKLNIIVPSMEQQIEVAKTLFEYYTLMRNNDDENQTLTKLRDTILPKLISGEVRVKDIKQTVAQVL